MTDSVGHESASTTHGNYGHLIPQAELSATEVDELLRFGFAPEEVAPPEAPEVTVGEATDEEAIQIAIRRLHSALREPAHRAVHVADARLWLRHL